MANSFLDKTKQRSAIGARGKQSEKKLAKRLGAKLTPASGAIKAFKGDFSLNDFLVEAKSTIAYSLGLKLEWLQKIRQEAKSVKKTPALMITFEHENGTPVKGGQWVCIPLDVWEDMTRVEEEV